VALKILGMTQSVIVGDSIFSRQW